MLSRMSLGTEDTEDMSTVDTGICPRSVSAMSTVRSYATESVHRRTAPQRDSGTGSLWYTVAVLPAMSEGKKR